MGTWVQSLALLIGLGILSCDSTPSLGIYIGQGAGLKSNKKNQNHTQKNEKQKNKTEKPPNIKSYNLPPAKKKKQEDLKSTSKLY